MTEREVRMRSIEALGAMGVRETQRLIRDAKDITEYVMAGEDKATPPRQAKKKTEDKAE